MLVNPCISSLIVDNINSEWDAINGYYEMLSVLDDINDNDSIDKIYEIISDEKNHINVLRDILRKYDKIVANSQ